MYEKLFFIHDKFSFAEEANIDTFQSHRYTRNTQIHREKNPYQQNGIEKYFTCIAHNSYLRWERSKCLLVFVYNMELIVHYVCVCVCFAHASRSRVYMSCVHMKYERNDGKTLFQKIISVQIHIYSNTHHTDISNTNTHKKKIADGYLSWCVGICRSQWNIKKEERKNTETRRTRRRRRNERT